MTRPGAPAALALLLFLLPLFLAPSSLAQAEAGDWWHYESTGEHPFLGASAGERVTVEQTDARTWTYTVHQRTSSSSGAVDTWHQRVYRFDDADRLVELVEQTTVQQEGQGPITDETRVSYEPAVPLRTGANWSANVTEQVTQTRADEDGPFQRDAQNRTVLHQVSANATATTWSRETVHRTLAWGAGWLLEERAGNASLRLVSTSVEQGDMDRDGTPDEEDEDADGDGYTRTEEEQQGTDPVDARSRPGTAGPPPVDTTSPVQEAGTGARQAGANGTAEDADGGSPGSGPPEGVDQEGRDTPVRNVLVAGLGLVLAALLTGRRVRR